ncbi:unnamed protein product [Cuscuta campestris]|uniref:Uncharacterized protein n=1 Tax=Cuscuta campestris TaxID=132261 RepID=A0A484LSS8_9ASTE|nr:unnamed protein product [Cuscuta campestris]
MTLVRSRIEPYITWRVYDASLSFWWDNWTGLGPLARVTNQAHGKTSLMGGNEEVKVQMDDRNGEGNAEARVKCGDNDEMSFDAGGPSFDLLTPMPKVDAAGDDNPNANSGNVSVTKACDAEKERKCVEIPFTETQYDPRVRIIDQR